MFWGFSCGDEEILVQQFLSQTLNILCKLTTCAWKSIVTTVCSCNLSNYFFFLDCSHSIFIVPNVSSWWVIVITSSLAYYSESMYFWLVMVNLWWKNNCLWIMFQKLVWEWSSEKGTINIDRSELRNINFFTSWAEYLKSRDF